MEGDPLNAPTRSGKDTGDSEEAVARVGLPFRSQAKNIGQRYTAGFPEEGENDAGDAWFYLEPGAGNVRCCGGRWRSGGPGRRADARQVSTLGAGHRRGGRATRPPPRSMGFS